MPQVALDLEGALAEQLEAGSGLRAEPPLVACEAMSPLRLRRLQGVSDRDPDSG
jgi:hypothetical protein